MKFNLLWALFRWNFEKTSKIQRVPLIWKLVLFAAILPEERKFLITGVGYSMVEK